MQHDRFWVLVESLQIRDGTINLSGISYVYFPSSAPRKWIKTKNSQQYIYLIMHFFEFSRSLQLQMKVWSWRLQIIPNSLFFLLGIIFIFLEILETDCCISLSNDKQRLLVEDKLDVFKLRHVVVSEYCGSISRQNVWSCWFCFPDSHQHLNK